MNRRVRFTVRLGLGATLRTGIGLDLTLFEQYTGFLEAFCKPSRHDAGRLWLALVTFKNCDFVTDALLLAIKDSQLLVIPRSDTTTFPFRLPFRFIDEPQQQLGRFCISLRLIEILHLTDEVSVVKLLPELRLG